MNGQQNIHTQMRSFQCFLISTVSHPRSKPSSTFLNAYLTFSRSPFLRNANGSPYFFLLSGFKEANGGTWQVIKIIKQRISLLRSGRGVLVFVLWDVYGGRGRERNGKRKPFFAAAAAASALISTFYNICVLILQNFIFPSLSNRSSLCCFSPLI